MNGIDKDITADAIALQERDEFRSQGWLKLIAPAKVNLHLAIGGKRPDGYHDAATVLHALSRHDVVYMRRRPGGGELEVRMISQTGVEIPELSTADNIAARAVELKVPRLVRVNLGPPMLGRLDRLVTFLKASNVTFVTLRDVANAYARTV